MCEASLANGASIKRANKKRNMRIAAFGLSVVYKHTTRRAEFPTHGLLRRARMSNRHA